MINIISRYLFREAFAAWVLVTAVLLAILLSNQFARVLGDAAANRLPRDAVFTMLGLSSVQFLTILAPIGLFLGILLALARFNRDSEMAAMMACGIGPLRLLAPLGLLALLVGSGLTWLSLVGSPEAAARTAALEADAKQRVELTLLEPGRFTSPDSGETIVYAAGRTPQGGISDVFIQRREGGRVAVILATDGERVASSADDRQSLVLRNGRRYEGRPGTPNFRIVEFEEHGIPLELDVDEAPDRTLQSLPTSSLLGARDPEYQAELQWRVAAPLTVLVLTLLAVPLSRSNPRQGRYGRVIIGILVYILYTNLLAIARVWMERETLPTSFGLWWVHGIFAAVALTLLLRHAGVFARAESVEAAA